MNYKKRYYIFAGSYDQFRFYIRDNSIDQKDAVYVYNPRQLRGIHFDNAEFVKYGTWYENKLATEILDEIKNTRLSTLSVKVNKQ